MLIVVGRLEARPAIISEKKIPMDSTKPELVNVAIMPEAAPRCLAGTLFITAAALGAENRPMPAPEMKIRMAKAG